MAVHEVQVDDLVLFDSIETPLEGPVIAKTLDNKDLHQQVAVGVQWF